MGKVIPKFKVHRIKHIPVYSTETVGELETFRLNEKQIKLLAALYTCGRGLRAVHIRGVKHLQAGVARTSQTRPGRHDNEQFIAYTITT